MFDFDHDDTGELNQLLVREAVPPHPARRPLMPYLPGGRVQAGWDEEDDLPPATANPVQWATADHRTFIPTGHTRPRLAPGAYEIRSNPGLGVVLEKVPVQTQGLLRFPQTESDRVVHEIQTFWQREPLFRRHGLAYKRGILLWRPPGSGKTCTRQLVMRDVVDRAGVVLKFTAPALFLEGLRQLRAVEPDTPVVVIMEDLDATLQLFNESEVLNILDGVERVDRVVFLATTNHPERLGARVVNRPSRFDKRFKIGLPDAEARRTYLRHLAAEAPAEDAGVDLECWVADTDQFSLAHLKELFVAVVVLGDDYAEAVQTLRAMREVISSADEKELPLEPPPLLPGDAGLAGGPWCPPAGVVRTRCL